MKYYLVNYIILDKKKMIENENIGITLYNYANIDDFKKSIAASRNGVSETDNIVIKSYKQISKEAYISSTTTML